MQRITELVIKDIHPEWKKLLNTLSVKDRNKQVIDILDECLSKVLDHRQKNGTRLCPDKPDLILRCLRMNPNDIKCVILGQDPYPQFGVATGLAFACKDGKQPSMQIMIRELEAEYHTSDLAQRFDTTLESWEKEGVLLLNTSLSCDEGKPKSHTEHWRPFMIELMLLLNNLKLIRDSMSSIVFVALGLQAFDFLGYVNSNWHYVIRKYHPAAESHGNFKFEGFSYEVNNCLEKDVQTGIKWI